MKQDLISIKEYADQLGFFCKFTPQGHLLIFKRQIISGDGADMFDRYERQNRYVTQDELERTIGRMVMNGGFY